jgi:hypothetical protein
MGSRVTSGGAIIGLPAKSPQLFKPKRFFAELFQAEQSPTPSGNSSVASRRQ